VTWRAGRNRARLRRSTLSAHWVRPSSPQPPRGCGLRKTCKFCDKGEGRARPDLARSRWVGSPHAGPCRRVCKIAQTRWAAPADDAPGRAADGRWPRQISAFTGYPDFAPHKNAEVPKGPLWPVVSAPSLKAQVIHVVGSSWFCNECARRRR
jgi:hypothetical protein